MNIIYIYGPPASGKLTVAKELAKITEYKVIHNHLFVDLAHSIFEFRSEDFADMLFEIRSKFIEIASKKGLEGLIYTSAYNSKYRKKLLDRIVKQVKSEGGEIFFVQLYANKEELLKRVEAGSRKRFGKLKQKEDYLRFMKESGSRIYDSVEYKNNYKIDNTEIPAKEVAKMIVAHYKINEK